MPQYKTHNHFNFFLILPIVILGGYYFLSIPKRDLIIFSSAFAYSSLFMNPDLDLANKIKLFSLRGVLTIPFRTYSWIFRHRGLSHHLILGTLTRVLWLFLFVFTFSIIFMKIGMHSLHWKSLFSIYRHEFMFALFGILLADLAHLFLDSVSTCSKS